MTEIRNQVYLYLEEDCWGDLVWKDRTGNLCLCPTEFYKEVAVPKRCKKMTAVFTVDKRAASFTITDPREEGSFGATSFVKEYKGLMYVNAQRWLAKQYEAGRRYVHFEYV